MKKASQNYQGRENTPFMKIKEAAQVTSLSIDELPDPNVNIAITNNREKSHSN